MLQASKENFQAAVRNNLMSPDEAAAMLGVTVGTLQVWRSTRRYPLPFVKSGRKVMYRIEALQAFIESRTISPMEV
jgi:excisionase family DNA binding protein